MPKTSLKPHYTSILTYKVNDFQIILQLFSLNAVNVHRKPKLNVSLNYCSTD